MRCPRSDNNSEQSSPRWAHSMICTPRALNCSTLSGVGRLTRKELRSDILNSGKGTAWLQSAIARPRERNIANGSRGRTKPVAEFRDQRAAGPFETLEPFRDGGYDSAMDLDEFERHLRASEAAYPKRFALNDLAGAREEPCSDLEISSLEDQLGIVLPREYKVYLARYGGGYIANINVFSAHSDSEWYLPHCNRFIPRELDFIAITDDQTGGYFGFMVQANKCSDEVYFWAHDDGSDPAVIAHSFFEYVVAKGLP